MSTQHDDLRHKDLCFIDVETTGSVFGFHEIIEVAAIRTSPDALQILGTWIRRIRPRFPERITALARDLNRYNSEEWRKNLVASSELWQEFNRFVQECVPVCHNPSFDRAFLTLAATAEGVRELDLDYHWIGTESLAWPFYKAGRIEKLSLEALCVSLGIEPEPLPHTALGGAKACRQVYLRLLESLGDEAILGDFHQRSRSC